MLRLRANDPEALLRYNCKDRQELIISDLYTIEEQSLIEGDSQNLDQSAASVARSTAIMSIATLLSRATGFIRMWATGLALGVGITTSAYNLANNVPNMIFELVAGGILSSLFIPTYMEVKAERGEDEAWRFASHVFNLSVVALGIVAIVGIVLPEPFIWTQTFRFSPDSADTVRDTAEFFFRFFAIQVVLYGGGMVMQAVLNAQRKYLWTALGPIFNNLVVIGTMIYISTQPLNTKTLTILALGTTGGVAAMFIVMIPSLFKIKLKYHFGLGLKDRAVRRMMRLALPTVVYVVTNLVTVSFRNASALSVSGSGPGILLYAWTWYQLPYGILAVALATALFTELSDYASKKDVLQFKKTFSRGLRATAVLIIPAAGMVFILAEPLTNLFVVGRFKPEDIPLVTPILQTWSFALVFFACMMFVLRAFYSLKDTKTPATINLVTSTVQVAGYLILTTGIGAWSGLGLRGIPFTDVIFSALQFGVLLFFMRKKIGPFDIKSFINVFIRMTLATIVASAAVHFLIKVIDPYFLGVSGALAEAAIGATVGFGLAFGLAVLLRVEEITIVNEILKKVASKFRIRVGNTINNK